MKEEYYLIPKSKFTAMVDKYGDWDSVDENQDIVNGINELTKDCILVDLSDSAIEDASKKWGFSDTEAVGFIEGFKNLKNKLNGNK